MLRIFIVRIKLISFYYEFIKSRVHQGLLREDRETSQVELLFQMI